jgi:hypothetical protein
MLTAERVSAPIRSFYAIAGVVIAVSLAAGAMVATPEHFTSLLKWSASATGLAAGLGSIQSDWSRAQRACLWVAASCIGFSFGVIGRFLF